MRIPDSLASLLDHGIIEEVVRPLMSGKEAEVYLVLSGGEHRVAKVYKESQNRTFKHRSDYTEGRKVRNSRDQRAMERRTGYGRAQDEAAWRTAEVDMIYRLRDAGVRVPTPHHFIDGVLIMELIQDEHGNPAPRLGDVPLEPADAQVVFDRLLVEVVRMLCAGVVHGDLSDFNVLMGPDGPVIIDFPQAVNASSNQNAKKLLVRDVDNLHRFMTRCHPEYQALPYAQEMWQLYERNQLTPDTRLSGRHRASERRADTASVLSLIGDANYDERRRREGKGLNLRGLEQSAQPARRVEVVTKSGDPRGRGEAPRRIEVVTKRSSEPRVPGAAVAPQERPAREQREHGRSETRPEARAEGHIERGRHPEPRPDARPQPPAPATPVNRVPGASKGRLILRGQQPPAPEPSRSEPRAESPSANAQTSAEGAEKRRRRRRRRKPAGDGPKSSPQ